VSRPKDMMGRRHSETVYVQETKQALGEGGDGARQASPGTRFSQKVLGYSFSNRQEPAKLSSGARTDR
jgi:hypothetical protein